MRVYFVGSHSTGKTTLARWVAETWGLRLINEVVRNLLAEMETTLEDIRLDPVKAGVFQKRVMTQQVEAERKAGGSFVSDRSFDNLAYAHDSTLDGAFITEFALKYVDSVRKSEHKMFFVRPHRSLLTSDGIRVIESWEEVIRIDGMVKMLLESANLDYISVDTVNPAERQRLIYAVLGRPA